MLLIHRVLAAAGAADRAQEAAVRRASGPPTSSSRTGGCVGGAGGRGDSARPPLLDGSGWDSFVSVGTGSGPNIYVEMEVRVVRGQPV